MVYRVFRSDWYDKKLAKLEKSEENRVLKIEKTLKIKPFTGRPLGFEFFREKKFDGKRLLFLIYSEYEVVFLITITDKKLQQNEIEMIRANLESYKDTIRNTLNKL